MYTLHFLAFFINDSFIIIIVIIFVLFLITESVSELFRIQLTVFGIEIKQKKNTHQYPPPAVSSDHCRADEIISRRNDKFPLGLNPKSPLK